jgi:hypothetical protein
MAPLADVGEADLPSVIRRMDERLSREATAAEAAMLWTATYWLLGLRVSAEPAGELLRGVRAMLESTTYQATLAEGEARGRAEEARRFLLRLGTRRFGAPAAEIGAAVEALDDPERIEQSGDCLLEVASGEELGTTR